MAVDSHPYLFLVLFTIFALGFCLAPLAMAWFWAKRFSPRKSGPSKNAIYECGLESQGDAWLQFKVDYYLYGILFLIFDVEALFLLPFAVCLVDLGHAKIGAFVAMMIFLLMLVEGLIWAWRKGILKWR